VIWILYWVVFLIIYIYSPCIGLAMNAALSLIFAVRVFMAGQPLSGLFFLAVAVFSAYLSYREYKKRNQPKS